MVEDIFLQKVVTPFRIKPYWTQILKVLSARIHHDVAQQFENNHTCCCSAFHLYTGIFHIENFITFIRDFYVT